MAPAARSSLPALAGVLLDLDGTLLDTAPDMARALNALRAEHQLSALALERIRPHVSHGSAAVVRAGFAEAEAPQFEALRGRFLELYRAALVVDTRLFAGFAQVLDALDAGRIPWGVVTNKPGWLTEPLLEALGLRQRAHSVVSGDSVPRRKPDPLPLQVAAQALGVPAARCLYLGDALRDAQAAQAAGMVALGARYGYLDAEDHPETWPVTAWIDSPVQLLDWVGLPRPAQTAAAALAQSLPADS